MNKKNDGKIFESMTARVFEILSANEHTSVEKDVQLDGLDAPRQIDVLMRSRVAGIEITTIVECRDYNKRLDITHVDGLHSKMQDVNADKAVLVSRRGFSKSAMRKALRVGITLCTLDETKESEDGLKSVGQEVPILLKEIVDLTVYIEGSIDTANVEGSEAAMRKPAEMIFGEMEVINGVNISDRVREAFLSGEFPVADSATKFEWMPPDMAPPYLLGEIGRDPKVPFDNFKILISYTTNYFFGYASELNGSVLFKNLSQKSENLIYDLSDIITDRDQFTKLRNKDEIPIPASSIEVQAISVPVLDDRNFQVFGIKNSS